MISMKFHWHKTDFIEVKIFIGSMSLLTTNNSFRTCGGPEAVTAGSERNAIKKKCIIQ